MPLPPFDGAGNLSVGDYIRDSSQCQVVATLAEIKHTFVDAYPLDTRRREIWNGWMRHRSELAHIGLDFTTMVNGSFTSAKMRPDDIDIAVMMDGQRVDKLKARAADNFNRLFDVDAAKATYLCHPQLLPMYPYGHKRFLYSTAGHGYFTRVFGRDKITNTYKAILIVEGTGVI